MHHIAVIPGDGIGAEVTREAVKVLRHVAHQGDFALHFEAWDLGAERYLRTGQTITDEEMRRIGEADAILLGAMGDPRVPGNQHARDILLGLRFRLDLYINLRPVRLYDTRLSPLRDVQLDDIAMDIFRENTEGVYVGSGGNFKEGTPDEVAIQEDINTRKGVERIIRAAFEHARVHGRHVTLSDKANAMPHAGSLWRRTFTEVGAEYPDVERHAMYADALAMEMIRAPARWQVIVAPNLFGDLLSDLAAGLVGGLGLAPSASLHPGRTGLFEPVHGSAPDLVGTGKANPLAAILTAGLLLEHLGHPQDATRVEAAVRAAVRDGATTPDLGGTLDTAQVGDGIVAALGR